MAVQDLVKGELDWHEKMNANMHSLQNDTNNANQKAQDAVGAVEGAITAAREATQKAEQVEGQLDTKLTKAEVTEEFQEEGGYVYQMPDGTTQLKAGGGSGPTKKDFKYTILVDNGDDGSPAKIEYFDDCVGFIPGSGASLGDWANTQLYQEYFKPCVIQAGDGAPAYYLQKDDMSKKEDGFAAVTTGADGDVMIEVKKLYGKFLKSGNQFKVSISNKKEDDTWFCFTDFGNGEQEVAYRGAFEAGVISGAGTVMRSVSGVSPLVNITRNVGRTYARNRGTGYHQNNFYLLLLWQIMYLLIYKNKNSQTALGQGRTLSSNTAAVQTGTLLSKPFCWGDQGGVNGVKFLGVENFYGNVWEWVDGVCLVNKTYKMTRDPAKYNDTGDGYEMSQASGCTASANNDKYVTKVQATNDAGFLPAGSGGSSSTYWCDNMWFADAVQVVRFGGHWSSAAKAGAFCWNLDHTASSSHAHFGSRLCRA